MHFFAFHDNRPVANFIGRFSVCVSFYKASNYLQQTFTKPC